ncbi:MAG: PD-(D/E)XK nuclease family protein [Candidatus Pacebacteria bacterium]|nr:PD-(D/E)XK nuclease family protein [Candidatus Paceibacterota bacterium]
MTTPGKDAELDKFTAVWVSHSSITDYLNCPRSYFLRNVYKDPLTNRKVSLINPSLALGQIIHEVLESLSVLPLEKRFDIPLLERFDRAWLKVAGERGGFESEAQEEKYLNRGREMLRRVIKNPGPLKKLAVKINKDLPYFWLSEKDNLILCGKIDWLEYLPETDQVHIIDFKTGKSATKNESLQLPIYRLLAANCQERGVAKASYWYLELENEPVEQALPDLDESFQKVLKIARRIKLARQLSKFDCPQGKEGCRYCLPLEKILTGEASLVGVNDFGQNVYTLKKAASDKIGESQLL